MRHTCLLFLVCLLFYLSACSSPTQKAILGKWQSIYDLKASPPSFREGDIYYMEFVSDSSIVVKRTMPFISMTNDGPPSVFLPGPPETYKYRFADGSHLIIDTAVSSITFDFSFDGDKIILRETAKPYASVMAFRRVV